MANTLKKKDLDRMTIEELEALAQDLDAEKVEVMERKRMVADALSEKVLEDQALRRLETMSDEEKRVLLQHLKVDGIKSKAKVGTPGGSDEEDDEE